MPEKVGKHFFSAIVDQILFIFSSRFCLFCAFTRLRYQVSVYRTIGPLVCLYDKNSDAGFPNFCAARTPYLMYDVYTNDSVFPDSD